MSDNNNQPVRVRFEKSRRFFVKTPYCLVLEYGDSADMHHLYDYYQMVAWKQNGMIAEGSRTIADKIGMCKERVLKARKRLEEEGLIQVNPAKPGRATEVILLESIWEQNELLYGDETAATTSELSFEDELELRLKDPEFAAQMRDMPGIKNGENSPKNPDEGGVWNTDRVVGNTDGEVSGIQTGSVGDTDTVLDVDFLDNTPARTDPDKPVADEQSSGASREEKNARHPMVEFIGDRWGIRPGRDKVERHLKVKTRGVDDQGNQVIEPSALNRWDDDPEYRVFVRDKIDYWLSHLQTHSKQRHEVHNEMLKNLRFVHSNYGYYDWLAKKNKSQDPFGFNAGKKKPKKKPTRKSPGERKLTRHEKMLRDMEKADASKKSSGNNISPQVWMNDVKKNTRHKKAEDTHRNESTSL